MTDKFRYIIQDFFSDSIVGTNDIDVANKYIMCNDYCVYDSETGEWFSGECAVKVKQVGQKYTEEDWK